jgi:hypothetical protein
MPTSAATRGSQDSLTIDLQTDAVDALFHPFDPSPLPRRIVSSEADAYVVERVSSVPDDAPLELRILLPASAAARCDDVQEAFRGHYASCAARQRLLLRRHFREAGLMLLKGIVFAVILITIARSIAAFSESLLMSKIAGGLSLIVWVCLWRPVDMLIYEWRPLKNEVKLRDRLAEIRVRCITSE